MLALLPAMVLVAAVQAGVGPPTQETTGSVEVGPAAAVLSEHDVEVTPRGSPESMARQHAVAVATGLTFVGTLEEMEVLAEQGQLVPIPGGRHYEVMDWVFPYGLPEVRTFVERLAAQYRAACGNELVVTSLTRPFSEQPPNAHQLSVHPAGMAADFRIPRDAGCREFLENRLLEREEAGLLDVTREVAPPHYHVALFPEPYSQWVELQPPQEGAAPRAEPEREPETGGAARVVLWVALSLAALATLLVAAWVYRRGAAR